MVGSGARIRGFRMQNPSHLFSCLNCDGGVDGSDIEAFFIMFDAGDPSADVHNDGGVDRSDVQVFFEVWERGELGCG